MSKRLLSIVAAFMLAGVGAFVLSPGASAQTVSLASASVATLNTDGDRPLRKKDYQRYCRSQGYWGVDARGSGAYFLRCVERRSAMEITVTDVCAQRYGDSYISRLRTMGGVAYNRWGCFSGEYAGTVSKSDMRRQCRQQGGYLTTSWNKYPAYRWRCGNGDGINMTRLCKRLYGRNAIDRIDDLYNAYSWECYYRNR